MLQDLDMNSITFSLHHIIYFNRLLMLHNCSRYLSCVGYNDASGNAQPQDSFLPEAFVVLFAPSCCMHDAILFWLCIFNRHSQHAFRARIRLFRFARDNLNNSNSCICTTTCYQHQAPCYNIYIINIHDQRRPYLRKFFREVGRMTSTTSSGTRDDV